jgi:UDP-glucose 4-epimerase
MSAKTTILVTGGAGYIGSHTILELAASNRYRIISVDNYSNSTAETYRRIESIAGQKIEFIEADLSIASEAEAIFKKHPGISGVIHFAAFKSVPESVANPLLYYRNNINSLINLLEAGKSSTRHFIFSSSCSVYGNIEKLPVNESTPIGIIESPYAYTKVIGEKILADFILGNPQLNGIALRYFNPVGAHESGLNGELPNQRPNNLVPVITQTAIGKIKMMEVFGNDYDTRDGTCVRDYVHVCDIADAHVKAIDLLIEKQDHSPCEIFNLGTGTGVTVLEAIKTFEAISGVNLNYKISPRRTGDVAAIYSDCTKASTVLNWKAKRDLNTMMETAWKWELNLAKK